MVAATASTIKDLLTYGSGDGGGEYDDDAGDPGRPGRPVDVVLQREHHSREPTTNKPHNVLAGFRCRNFFNADFANISQIFIKLN